MYLRDCRARNLSEATITRDYGHTLSLLVAALGNPRAEDVTLDDLRDYVLHLRSRDKFENGEHPWMEQREGEKLSPWTVKRSVKTIKTFFAWAARGEYLEQNPAARLAYPKTPQGRVEVFSDAEALALLDAAKEASFRDYAIVMLMLDSGLRRAEVCDILTTDMNIGASVVDVRHGKGDKFRRVSFGARCQAAQWTYNSRYRQPKLGVDAFYLTRSGSQASAQLGRDTAVGSRHSPAHRSPRLCTKACFAPHECGSPTPRTLRNRSWSSPWLSLRPHKQYSIELWICAVPAGDFPLRSSCFLTSLARML